MPRKLHTITIEAQREGAWVRVAEWERFASSPEEARNNAIDAARAEFPEDRLLVTVKNPHRMGPNEYFWNYEFRFDLRDATRGEQEAVRTVFLAQKVSLDGFTPKHIALVEIVLGHESAARKSPYVFEVDGEVLETLDD